jgi:ribosomal protein S13
MQKSPEEIAIGVGEWVAESIINDVGFNPDLCLAALKKTEALIIKAAGIDPILYYQRVFEEVQNAIDRKEIC